jgi:hypothetical protein
MTQGSATGPLVLMMLNDTTAVPGGSPPSAPLFLLRILHWTMPSKSLSLAARLVRAYLRILAKQPGRAHSSIEAERRHLKHLTWLIPRPPHDTETIGIDAGGVKADRIATPASRHDRHILYLHGGCYVGGSPGLYRDLTWRLANSAARSCCASTIGSHPSIPFRQHLTIPSGPTAGCSHKVPIRTA